MQVQDKNSVESNREEVIREGEGTYITRADATHKQHAATHARRPACAAQRVHCAAQARVVSSTYLVLSEYD